MSTEQLTKQNETISITGVDTAKGIAMTGSLGIYKQLLSDFREDVEKRLLLLQTIPESETLPLFVIQINSIKGDCASIGTAELSIQAAGLEAAGRAGDMVFIQENLPVFTEKMAELIGGIRAWEKTINTH